MDASINNGQLITSRRPNPKFQKKATDFTTCIKCLGPYDKNGVRHHMKRCAQNFLNGERSVLVLGRAVEGRIHVIACDELRLKIFPSLRDGEVANLIRFDGLVITYGNRLCDKYTKPKNRNLKQKKLRLAGRFLRIMKSICPDVSDFASIFQPEFYKKFVEAVRIIGKLDTTTKRYGSPSTAAEVVNQIKEIGEMLKCEYIIKRETENKLITEDFLTMVKSDTGASIYKAVYDTIAQMQREKRDRIPTMADVKIFAEYLDRERKKCFTHLQQKFSYPLWLQLSELTMVSIIVFNRKRVGETQNMLVSDFDRRDSIDAETVST